MSPFIYKSIKEVTRAGMDGGIAGVDPKKGNLKDK